MSNSKDNMGENNELETEFTDISNDTGSLQTEEMQLFTVQVEGYSVTTLPSGLKGTEWAEGINYPTGDKMIVVDQGKVTIDGLMEGVHESVTRALLDHYFKNHKMPDAPTVEKIVQNAYIKKFGKAE